MTQDCHDGEKAIFVLLVQGARLSHLDLLERDAWRTGAPLQVPVAAAEWTVHLRISGAYTFVLKDVSSKEGIVARNCYERLHKGPEEHVSLICIYWSRTPAHASRSPLDAFSHLRSETSAVLRWGLHFCIQVFFAPSEGTVTHWIIAQLVERACCLE